MATLRPACCQRVRRILLAIVLAAGICACGHDASKIETTLSGDERYLVARYVDIRTAQLLHDTDPAAAESLFSLLQTTVDTARVDSIIAAVNSTPERWVVIMREIERRVRASVDSAASEHPR